MAGVPRSGRSVQRRVCRVLSAITVMSHNYMGARARASPRLQQSTLFVTDVFGLKPASIVIVEAWKRNSRKSQAPKSKSQVNNNPQSPKKLARLDGVSPYLTCSRKRYVFRCPQIAPVKKWG